MLKKIKEFICGLPHLSECNKSGKGKLEFEFDAKTKIMTVIMKVGKKKYYVLRLSPAKVGEGVMNWSDYKERTKKM